MKISTTKISPKTPVLIQKTSTIYNLPPNWEQDKLEKKNWEMFQKWGNREDMEESRKVTTEKKE
jgi:hypothetical protein